MSDHPDPHDSDVTVVASVSGGKDSAAMCLWLQEQGVPYRAVFMDTGWEHPATYEYLRGPLTEAVGPIEEIRAERQMADLIRHKGMFPSRLRRFCTQELKIFPFQKWCQENVDGELVNAVGIRAGESKARSQMGEWEWTDWLDGHTWRPLIHWSEADVIDIHQRHGLVPNPLYLKGMERVGCWPCIFARKSEIAKVAELTPERIDEIRELEAHATASRNARAEAKGTVAKYPAAMFTAKGKRMLPIAIDDVVSWAQTDRGGRQLLLLDKEPPGCMRWGLCDALPPEADDDERREGGGE